MRSLYPWPLFPSDLDSRATRSLSLQLSIQEWIATFDALESVEKKNGRTSFTGRRSSKAIVVFSR